MKFFRIVLILVFITMFNTASYAGKIDLKLNNAFSNDKSKSINLKDFLGKKVVLAVFFYPKCHPCEISSRTINRIYRKFADSITIVGISLSKDRYDLEDFVENFHIKYPIYRIDDKNQLKCVGGIFATPTILIFNKQSKIVDRIIGPRSYAAMITKLESYIK